MNMYVNGICLVCGGETEPNGLLVWYDCDKKDIEKHAEKIRKNIIKSCGVEPQEIIKKWAMED